MNKSTVTKLIIFCLCSLVFLYSFIGCVIVSHAAETADVITVEYTVDDIKALFDTVDSYAIYDGVKIPTEINPQFDIADGLAFYTCRLQAPSGNAAFEFKFPFEATVLSSNVTIMSGDEGYSVAWDTADNLYPWSLTSEGYINFASGFSAQTYTYDYIGTITTSNLYFNVNTYHSDNASILFGIKSLSITYLGSEFNEIVDQLKEQNIILEGIENAIEETNEKLDDVKTSIEQSSQDIIDNQNKNHEDLTTSTDEDKAELNELEQDFQDVKDKADEYNEAMESVDKPEADDVLSDDAVADIFENEDVSQGQPYIFSILESLQSITWLLTMILISVTVGIIKYIIYGKS